jgi:hypothetical protein
MGGHVFSFGMIMLCQVVLRLDHPLFFSKRTILDEAPRFPLRAAKFKFAPFAF